MTNFNERRSLLIIALVAAALFFAVFLAVTSGALGHVFDPEGEARDDAAAAAAVGVTLARGPLLLP